MAKLSFLPWICSIIIFSFHARVQASLHTNGKAGIIPNIVAKTPFGESIIRPQCSINGTVSYLESLVNETITSTDFLRVDPQNCQAGVDNIASFNLDTDRLGPQIIGFECLETHNISVNVASVKRKDRPNHPFELTIHCRPLHSSSKPVVKSSSSILPSSTSTTPLSPPPTSVPTSTSFTITNTTGITTPPGSPISTSAVVTVTGSTCTCSPSIPQTFI